MMFHAFHYDSAMSNAPNRICTLGLSGASYTVLQA